MTKRDPEYDRFGPWVIEISEEDPPPPLFLPYLTRQEPALISIKIPRKIERRIANPGMNLYDYMVTLYNDDLVILERVENEVRTETFFYRDIKFIRVNENLLRGILHLGMPDNAYDLPFNTVSKEIIMRLVDLLRERYIAGLLATPVAEAFDVEKEDLSYYFGRLLASENVHYPDLQLLASQTDTAIGSSETSVWRRIVYGLISRLLLESLHLSNGREIKIISRGQRYKYKWQTVYGKDTCYMPTANINDVIWEEEAQNTAVLNLTLQTSGGSVTYAFTRDNPSIPTYNQFLSTVTGSAVEMA